MSISHGIQYASNYIDRLNAAVKAIDPRTSSDLEAHEDKSSFNDDSSFKSADYETEEEEEGKDEQEQYITLSSKFNQAERDGLIFSEMTARNASHASIVIWPIQQSHMY